MSALNRAARRADPSGMHGAWLFDLLLLLATGVTTILAFRQIVMEGDESDH